MAACGVIAAYNRHFARQGFYLEAAALRQARAARSREQALAAASVGLLQALCVQGSQAECVEQLARYRPAGIKTLLINPIAEPAHEFDHGGEDVIEMLSSLVQC
jgi:hypothetical protein